MADTTILSWITAEVDQALERVRSQLASYSNAGQDASVLATCPEHLHQVSGALSMVGLSGATRFCEVLEHSFSGLNGANAAGAALIDRGVLQLKEFVDDLARGEPNVAVRLYPSYRELAELQGKADSSEVDLFFPDLTPPAPSHPNPNSVEPGELPSFLQAQRTRWQRGILAWLRRQPNGLEEMRETLDAIHAVAHGLPERRAIWWVAGGLVDALLDVSEPRDLAQARALWNKTDLYIRDLAAGARTDNELLLRQMLYVIGSTAPLTQRIRDIKLLYGLDALVPGQQPAVKAPERDTLQPVLDEVREKLRKLKKFWRQYVSGEPKARETFRERTRSLPEKAAPLESRAFTRLMEAIGRIADVLPDLHPRESDAMLAEMAAAFMLADNILETFGHAPADLDDQVGLLSRWLVDAAEGRATRSPPAGLRAELIQEISTVHARAQVAREILANLQQIEQLLDGYARDPAANKVAPAVAPQLRQIHGALSVLDWHRAVHVLEDCENLIRSLVPGSSDMDWIAEGLSSLGFYVAPCLEGREPREQAIDTFLERFDKRPQPTIEAAAKPADEIQSDELLQVFLEEAGGVLGAIEAALPVCRAQPADVEALTGIRRGFHTLKGSGRMVGLSDFGDAAWEVEQVLNRWLEDKQPVSPELIEFMTQAARHCAAWTAKLAASERPEIDPGVIAGLAQRLKPDVLDVYLKEARTHVTALGTQCERWCANRGTSAPEDFMRAAHTLASSSRTAGFEPIADLAGALERWMPVAGLTLEDTDVSVIAEAVATLTGMVDLAQARQAPQPAAESIRQLGELVARLQPPRKPKEKRVMRDDIDPDLLPIFLEEADELVPQIAGDLRDWKGKPQDVKLADAVKRALHTLKGSARMAGAIRLGELTHLMESRIEFALEAGDLSAAVFEDLQGQMDRLSTDLEKMHEPQPPTAPVPARPAAPAVAAPVAPGPVAQASAPTPAPMLRVNADRVDSLITESGEVAIARSRIETELRQVKQSLSELDESIQRLRGQLREVEVQADSQMQSRRSVLHEREHDFDPLEFDRYTRLQELTRMMAEGVNDVASIQQALVKSLGETDAALLQQARIGRELQQDLMRMRALPFTNLAERLHRVVRQTARDLDKQAELAIDGGQVELDRSVLERVAAPLEHLLRNALAHGIEAPGKRVAGGKAEAGRIEIRLRQEGNEIVLSLADDGAGLDLARLRAKAIEKGLVGTDHAMSDAEKVQLVFLSGLSTADEVTELAGRGVGMDVVRTEINAIGGRVDVSTASGRGTTFTIYLPLTLAVTHTVMVKAGTMTAAVSSASVEQVMRLKAQALVGLYEKGSVEFQGREYPLHYLRELLGQRGATDIQEYNSLLLVRSANQRVAVHVDELLGNREMVVKSIGPQLARIAGITGATVLPDGDIVLIVNPVQLAQRARAGVAKSAAAEISVHTAAQAALTVMVVDDSITVRKITSRLLEREGYRVLTARDGVDALEQLKHERPALLLIDIEMPRMDGFDLTRNVRGDPRTMEIPIIVISSRTAPKHRSRAMDLGVNAYLGKPYEESELLQQIAALARR